MKVETTGHTVSGNDFTVKAVREVERFGFSINSSYSYIMVTMCGIKIDADDLTESNYKRIMEALKNA